MIDDRCLIREKDKAIRFPASFKLAVKHSTPQNCMKRVKLRLSAAATTRLRRFAVLLIQHWFYKFPRLYSSVMYSQARIVRARIVKVGLWFADETKLAPSVTNTFFTSCIWLKLFSTELFGSLPMRAVPSSWMMRPGAVI